MCPPLYFRSGAEERERALSQWRGLYRLLRDELSVHVDLLEPRPGLPDLACVGSSGFLVGDTFIAGVLADGLGKSESEPVENFFLVRGYHIAHLDKGTCCNDMRDLVLANGTLFIGSHSRDSQSARVEIEAIVGSEVVVLELLDSWLGPLATCLCPIAKGGAFFRPAAFTGAARKKLKACMTELVPVDEQEGGAAIGNSLIVGSHVIIAEGCALIRPILEGLGLTVHELALDAFSAVGGPRSLALQIGEG